MNVVPEVMSMLDRLLVWLAGHADWAPAGLRRHLVVPALVVIVLAAPRIFVHRVLPWTGQYVLVPATVVVTGALTAVALTVDFVLARLFRVFWLPLTGAHYLIGDWGIAGPRQARDGIRQWVHRSGRSLSRFSPGLLLAAGAVVLVLWDQGWCGRNPADGCATPIGVWWQHFLAAVPPFSWPWS
ncbi:hypothetical protein AB0G04_12805 [Actinoplanes sp. NPDC023801]|uniref:hypothetical protein n=1 Tax=Actinoplanes sp. NPDC023801 TaxID=3154595 RepID=UPI0033D7CA9C